MSAIAIQSSPPAPDANERPAVYADRIGRLYANGASQESKREFGQFFTPVEIAEFMARLCQTTAERVRALDPGAGAGVLSCALCEALAARRGSLKEIDLVAYESDQRLTIHLDASLSYAKRWLLARGIKLRYQIKTDDFVLAQSPALNPEPSLFPLTNAREPEFDLVITNPPYFKISKSDPRARAASAVVHGQPNIYALFMAISAALLKPGGRMVCITPRSYTAGPYFQLFRDRFFDLMRPEAIHLFGSRREAFGRDEVLQENLILLARRGDGWLAQGAKTEVEISFSHGAHDIHQADRRRLPLVDVLDSRNRARVLQIPLFSEDDQAVSLVRSWSGNLHTYGLEISTGPVVPFRAEPLLSRSGQIDKTHAPLLWMHNVTAMRAQWPVENRNKEQYIIMSRESKPLLVSNRNYVLLRRFSAKEARRRLIAAPYLASQLDSSHIGLENHLNYVHRPGGSLSETEAYGLAALLNSSVIDTYFRTFNGNTQISATELRTMPLPPLKLIRTLGARAMTDNPDLASLDDLIDGMFVNCRGDVNGEG